MTLPEILHIKHLAPCPAWGAGEELDKGRYSVGHYNSVVRKLLPLTRSAPVLSARPPSARVMMMVVMETVSVVMLPHYRVPRKGSPTSRRSVLLVAVNILLPTLKLWRIRRREVNLLDS